MNAKNRTSQLSSDQKSRASYLYEKKQRSPKVALVVSIFLGFLGVDRFYIRSYLFGVMKAAMPWLCIIMAIIGVVFERLLQTSGMSPSPGELKILFWIVSISGALGIITLLWWVVDWFLIKSLCRARNEKLLEKIMNQVRSL